jgi:NAD(P)-dependent dehydrogenase (short-subunit alcohol dehydrogenase family)
VVTGASSGIGRALALTLAERGASVIGLARRRTLLDQVAGELSRRSPGSATQICDVGDTDSYREALAGIEDDRGGIDVLVNNAGIDLMLVASEGELDTVRRVFDVNFFGTVAGTLAVLPGMVQRQSGIVVNVSSDSARAPEPGQGAYAASKAAISAFSESVAHEVGPFGVRVHLLYPAGFPRPWDCRAMRTVARFPPGWFDARRTVWRPLLPTEWGSRESTSTRRCCRCWRPWPAPWLLWPTRKLCAGSPPPDEPPV